MSKSRGNVVNPDEYIERFGADTTRMALVFLGPFDQDADFSEHGFVAIARFLRRVWECVTTDDQQPGVVIDSVVPGSDDRWSASDQAIRRVTEELEHQHFHTAIAALMEFTNLLREKRGHLDRAAFDEARRTLVLLLAPFAPHISEELWQRIGGTGSVHTQPWPEAVGEVSLVELPVQINGRFVDRVRIAADASDDVVREAALAQPKVSQVIGQRVIKRIVVVPGRIVNIVV
jgi:leucyl-tRNA synthetase